MSHPTWVRGLKHMSDDELLDSAVAPYVGAWIETEYNNRYPLRTGVSHPTWVRGLKPVP